MTAQYVDPDVTRAKFERQLGDFRALRAGYEARGWFLVDAEYPEVFVVLGIRAIVPPAILCGVLFDYTNYDAVPPSVCLVEPFTRRPYLNRELPTQLLKALPPQSVAVGGGALQLQGAQPLMQAAAPDEIPFLCVAGTREYHEHPGHSGDVWQLHRATGAGALVRILELVHRYGVEPICGYGVNLVPQVVLQAGQPPE